MGKLNIVFDMDGVLLDTERLYLKAYQIVGKELNLDSIEKAAYRCIGLDNVQSKTVFLEVYGKDFPYDEIRQKAFGVFNQLAESGFDIKPGVFELLNWLKEQSATIALATSTFEKTARHHLEITGLISYFPVIITGDMIQRGKPNPDIYLKACSEIGKRPDECFAIEDSYNGVRAASSAGLKTIMVPDIVQPNEEINQLYFKKMTSLHDVLTYFKKL